MADRLLTSNDREEAMSRAYAYAVAARAGYAVTHADFDWDGIDMEIKAGGAMRPAIAIQLKATIGLDEPVRAAYQYALRKRNYDLLRIPTQVPRILVVLRLPRDESRWLTVGQEELVLRHCAHWVSLRGRSETQNADSVTISLPEKNVFNVDSLLILMDQSRSGAIG